MIDFGDLVLDFILSFHPLLTVIDFESLTADPIFLGMLIGLGFVVGTAVGASGIGGAALLLPSLLFIGLPPTAVVGIDLAFNFFAKSFGTALHWKKHNISWRSLFYTAIVAVPAMVGAKFLWDYIKESYGSESLDLVILILIPTILFSIGVYMVWAHVIPRKVKDSLAGGELATSLKTKFSKGDKFTLMGVGGVVSFIMQITSVGAGTILVPVLLKVIRSPKHVAGTSILFGVISTAIGATLHGVSGNVLWHLVVVLLIGAFPGVLLGVRIASTISPQKLKIIFTVIIFAAASLILSKLFERLAA